MNTVLETDGEIDVSNVTFSPWDSVDYLTDEEAIREFMQAAAEFEDEPETLASAIRDALRARSINRIAQASGLDRALVCKFFPKNPAHALTPTVEQARALARALMHESV